MLLYYLRWGHVPCRTELIPPNIIINTQLLRVTVMEVSKSLKASQPDQSAVFDFRPPRIQVITVLSKLVVCQMQKISY